MKKHSFSVVKISIESIFFPVRVETLEGKLSQSGETKATEELTNLREEHSRLKQESASWRSMAERMLEEKETEISRLFDEVASLQGQLAVLEEQKASGHFLSDRVLNLYAQKPIQTFKIHFQPSKITLFKRLFKPINPLFF